MILRVEKDEIIDGLQKSANIIPSKTGAAYLRTIWLKVEDGGVQVMATDSNLEFTGSYQATVDQEGLAGINGRSFCDLMRKLPSGEVTFKLDPEKNTMQVAQGARKYKLPTSDATWFQNFSAFPEENSVFWSGDFLQELIDRISFCISSEDTLEAINCMSLRPIARPDGNNVIEACGLNGHQFAMLRFMHDDLYALLPQEGVLIQRKYLEELKRWLTPNEIELNISDKRLFIRTADKKETFSLPLSSYQYPDYHNFLSRLETPGVSKLEAPREELAHSLDRLLIFNTENNRCTYMDFQGSQIVLTTQGQDVGSANETLDVTFDGELDKIAFPTKNLIEILGHFQSDAVSFQLTGAEGPCGIEGNQDQDYVVIIMPMKIVEETYYSEEEA